MRGIQHFCQSLRGHSRLVWRLRLPRLHLAPRDFSGCQSEALGCRVSWGAGMYLARPPGV
eukprot:14866881-Heterocapsa_arctica.AAC.1